MKSFEKEAPKYQDRISDQSHIQAMRKIQLPGIWVRDGFSAMVCGDILLTRAFSQLSDSPVAAVVKNVQRADVSFGNLQNGFADIQNRPVYAGEPVSDIRLSEELKSLGFDMVSRANNHTTACGMDRMFETNQALRNAGVVFSGNGINLDIARAPHYVDTPKGRVGLVSMCMMINHDAVEERSARCAKMDDNDNTYPTMMADYSINNLGGLPGVNGLRVWKKYVLSPEEYETIERIKEEDKLQEKEEPARRGCEVYVPFNHKVGRPEHNQIQREEPAPDSYSFLYASFEKGSEETKHTIRYEHSYNDMRLNMRAVRTGKENSDLMIVSLYAKEQYFWSKELSDAYAMPAAIVTECAHQSIDNGADIFVVNGPEQTRGIEIYHGKPIFYGLGAWCSQLWGFPGLQRNSSHHIDEFYSETTGTELSMYGTDIAMMHDDNEGIMGEIKVSDGGIDELVVYPIYFDFKNSSMANAGTPHLASGDRAEKILGRIQRLSKRWNTEVVIDGDVGRINVRKTLEKEME